MRKMRRAFQQLDQAESLAILEKATSGTLACLDDNGMPYAVPLSHVLVDGKLYFHGAMTGHRIDAVTKNPNVSYCVIEQDKVIAETLTTHYRSVIVFGQARLLNDVTEKRIALFKLGEKFAPGLTDKTIEEIDRFIDAVSVMELTIDHLSGKEALELKKARQS
ncbi:MAG: pyridoxamine 5'-phosphate oxidase family protein [Burkholderiaceae bacterium]|nr:pyridoxamine 5'-phosphate oxidase family protein [Burkholderiaceae bacterium]